MGLRNIKFELTCAEYTIIKNKPCYICGIENDEYNHNGIDRIDSDVKIYNLSNCRPCCGHCNIMKNKYCIYKNI